MGPRYLDDREGNGSLVIQAVELLSSRDNTHRRCGGRTELEDECTPAGIQSTLADRLASPRLCQHSISVQTLQTLQ